MVQNANMNAYYSSGETKMIKHVDEGYKEWKTTKCHSGFMDYERYLKLKVRTYRIFGENRSWNSRSLSDVRPAGVDRLDLIEGPFLRPDEGRCLGGRMYYGYNSHDGEIPNLCEASTLLNSRIS